MKASLDTNVIIHFYRAGLQHILFDLFDEGVVIYSQIRDIELVHHGQDILDIVDADIKSGRIGLFCDDTLKEQGVFGIFQHHVDDMKILYQPGDLGEVYAIALAKTLGVYSLVTDDIKQGGPYMSLLQFNDEVMPFNSADVLILRYLMKQVNAEQTIVEFALINEKSGLNWPLGSRISSFFRRFWQNPYRESDTEWIKSLEIQYHINAIDMLRALNRCANEISKKQ